MILGPGVGVALGVSVLAGVGVDVLVGVNLGVAVLVEVDVRVGVEVLVGEGVFVADGVLVAVDVGVVVRVAVGAGLGVRVAVGVGIGEGVLVDVGVAARVQVGVVDEVGPGVWVGAVALKLSFAAQLKKLLFPAKLVVSEEVPGTVGVMLQEAFPFESVIPIHELLPRLIVSVAPSMAIGGLTDTSKSDAVKLLAKPTTPLCALEFRVQKLVCDPAVHVTVAELDTSLCDPTIAEAKITSLPVKVSL